MMGEVSLEMSLKNIMVQDMINSENNKNIQLGTLFSGTVKASDENGKNYKTICKKIKLIF